ncbi:DUF4350 domain-containing protein [Rathayibacter toxicus]|uniref:DUF4350 domain-containing protein n=1 Tax=Rathayibacter toxicus TaxID=145458 RepID=UPI000CE8FB28|nr:DUF4350 domain-containing protein [Rathayibacter toxicus]PPI53011.1 hypothetical protein C5D35_08655 [Rathayibacter toxicus]QOD10909.1 DUF4350 domain-containing protein [Rathayibacter toxicus]QWL27650.1 DUF4350 domain-containing protein [Rathayibacter toxicus]
MSSETISTPTVGTLLRRGRVWAVLLGLVVGGTLLVKVATGVAPLAADLDVDSSAPNGSRAVAQVLREQGVAVVRADGFDQALDRLDTGATLLVNDPEGTLSSEQYRRLAHAAGAVVLVAPPAAALDSLVPDVTVATAAHDRGTLSASCQLPAAQRAGTIPAGSTSYRVSGEATMGCFPSGDNAFALVTVGGTGHASITAIGDADLLRNNTIVQEGRAALALGLLGTKDRLVWYRADTGDAPPASLRPGDLAPGWLTPALLLVVSVFAAAAVWRGRRFGPLAVEPLPVVVHASETTHGRARLYARGATRLRALDALRIGTLRRMTALLGLPPATGVDEVITACAARIGRDPTSLRRLLVDDEPGGDAALVAASDALLTLERMLHSTLVPDPTPRPEGSSDERLPPAAHY